MPTLPSDFKLLLMGAVSISGIVAYFFGRKIMEWINIWKNEQDAKEAAAARQKADASDQSLNDQTAKLPKD